MPTKSGIQCALDLDDAAEDTLAALRRNRLVLSWNTTDAGTYDVLVGRGTVDVGVLDADGVLALAASLRRDRVTLVGRGRLMGHRWTQYELSDGRHLDRHDGRHGRYLDEYPYSVYVPGGDPSGCAIFSFAARTRVEALALAGLTRVRGRCTRCAHLRPLTWHNHGWRPDPTIRCPGCDASAATSVTLLCHLCREPIVRDPAPGTGPFRCVWIHEATRNSFCDTKPRAASFRDERRAQLR